MPPSALLATIASLVVLLGVNAYVQPDLRNHLASKLIFEGRTYPEGVFLPDVFLGDDLSYCYKQPAGRWRTWFRTAIYDALDYDAQAKTGGLDGSVFYEVDRYPEDVQKDILLTASDIESLPNKYLSRADALASLLILFGGECEYNLISASDYTFGRNDVYQPSPPSAVNKTGLTDTQLANLFTCADKFNYYPLGPDGTSQFICPPLLKKLLTFVPQGTTLAPVIDAWDDPEFYVDVSKLTIEDDDQLFLSLRTRLGYRGAGEQQFTVFWCDRYGENKDCALSTHKAHITTLDTPDSADGPSSKPGCFKVRTTVLASQYFVEDAWACDFRVPIDPELSVSRFWFERLDYGQWAILYDNAGGKYPVEQDVVVFVPGLSQAVYDEAQGLNVVHLVVAVKNTTQIAHASAEFYDYGRLTTSPPERPIQIISPLERNSTLGSSPKAGYDYYSAHFVVPKRPTGAVDFTIEAFGGEKFALEYVSAGRIPGYLGEERKGIPIMTPV